MIETIFNKLINFFYKKQRWLECLTITAFALTGAFLYKNGETYWLWGKFPLGAVITVLIVITGTLTWVRIEKLKVQNEIDQLKNIIDDKENGQEHKFRSLTKQERLVFNLIAEGKSNKEITSELFIELSTLKSHINRIYKKMDIKSRKEVVHIGKYPKTEA